MSPFAGIFPIVVTPFHDDGSIDLDSQLRLVEFLIESGAHGLGLFGTASEGYTLTQDERLALLRAIVRKVDGRIPLIVSTGHTGTDAAVALSRQAEVEGADALMVLPPYFLRPDADGVFTYFAAIDSAVGIPVMVQDAPLMTQVNIGATLLTRMARELEHVRYAKIEAPPTAPKISDILADGGVAPIIFGGLNGNFLIEELDRGARGCMPGSDLISEFVSIWDSWQSGELRRAREDFAALLPLIRYELQPGLGVSAMKLSLVADGVIGDARVRHPTRTLDTIGERELIELRASLRSSAI